MTRQRLQPRLLLLQPLQMEDEDSFDSRLLRRRSLSQLHQLQDEADVIQRQSRVKDHHLLSSVDNILLQSQQPIRMHRASSLPPPTARFASPSPYDPATANFYFLPTSHLRASSVARSSVQDTNDVLQDCRQLVRRSSLRSQSYQDLGAVESEFSPAASRAIRHAYGPTRLAPVTVVRARNVPLPPRPLPVSEERKRVERHLDSLVSYEMPSAENFTNMRSRLREINDKLGQHRTMIDKYTGVDLNPQAGVDERINDKYLELVSRMPELERNQHPGRRFSADYSTSSNYAVKGYSQGLLPGGGPPVSELRGRIRRLITRTRHDPNYFRQ